MERQLRLQTSWRIATVSLFVLCTCWSLLKLKHSTSLCSNRPNGYGSCTYLSMAARAFSKIFSQKFFRESSPYIPSTEVDRIYYVKEACLRSLATRCIFFSLMKVRLLFFYIFEIIFSNKVICFLSSVLFYQFFLMFVIIS